MMRYLLFFLFLSIGATAQERILINGRVTVNAQVLENVHLQNITTRKFAVTDEGGSFMIHLAAGDTLLFSHVSMQDLVKVVDQKDLKNDFLSIVMTEKDNELSEITIEERKIDVVSLGIISEKMEKPTVYERRLHTAGNFKWYHLFGLIGGSLNFDSVLNAINGRTKKIKRNISMEKKMEMISYLKSNHLAYMEKNFEASEEQIQQFLDFLVDQETLESVVSNNSEERLKFYLTDQWLKFKNDGK